MMYRVFQEYDYSDESKRNASPLLETFNEYDAKMLVEGLQANGLKSAYLVEVPCFADDVEPMLPHLASMITVVVAGGVFLHRFRFEHCNKLTGTEYTTYENCFVYKIEPAVPLAYYCQRRRQWVLTAHGWRFLETYCELDFETYGLVKPAIEMMADLPFDELHDLLDPTVVRYSLV